MSLSNQGMDPKRSLQNVSNQPNQYVRQHSNQQLSKQDHKHINDQQPPLSTNSQFPNTNQLGTQQRTQTNSKHSNVGKQRMSNIPNTGTDSQQQLRPQVPPPQAMSMNQGGFDMNALPDALMKQYEDQMKELQRKMMEQLVKNQQLQMQQQSQMNGSIHQTNDEQMQNGHSEVINNANQEINANNSDLDLNGDQLNPLEQIQNNESYQNGKEQFNQENNTNQDGNTNLQDNESAGSYNDPGQQEDYVDQDYQCDIQNQEYQEGQIPQIIEQNGVEGEEFSVRSSVESQYYEDKNDATLDHSQMCYDEPSQMHHEDGEFPYGSEHQFEGSQQSQEVDNMNNHVYDENDQNGYYVQPGMEGEGEDGVDHQNLMEDEQYYEEDEMIIDENYQGDNDNTYNYQDQTNGQLSNGCDEGQYIVEEGFDGCENVDFAFEQDGQKVSSGGNNSQEYGDEENNQEYDDNQLILKQGVNETGIYKFEEDQVKPKQFLSQQSLNNSEQHINPQNENYHTVDENISVANYQESFGRYPQDKSNSVSAHSVSLGGGSFGHQPAEKSNNSATARSFSLGGGSACPAPAKMGGPGTTGNNTDQQCLSNGPSFGGFDGQCINGQEFDEDGNPHQHILGQNQLDLPSGSGSVTEDPGYQDKEEFQENQFDNEMVSSRVASCTDWGQSGDLKSEQYPTDLELPKPFFIQRILSHRYETEEEDDNGLEFRCVVTANVMGCGRQELSGDQEPSGETDVQGIGDMAEAQKTEHWIALQEIFGSEIGINKIHLKYYCKQNQLIFDGIDGIDDLASQEQQENSGNDQQDNQVIDESHNQKLPINESASPNENYEKEEDEGEKKRVPTKRRRKVMQSSSNSAKSDSDDVEIPNEPVSKRRGKANDTHAARDYPTETIKTRSGRISKRLPINMLTSTQDDYLEVRKRGRGAKVNKRQRVERDEDDEDYKQEEESPIEDNSYQSEEGKNSSQEEECEENTSDEETKRGGVDLGLGFHSKSSSHQTERNAKKEVEGETKKRYSTRSRTKTDQNVNKRNAKVENKNVVNFAKLKKRDQDIGYNTQGYEDKEDLIQNDDEEEEASDYERPGAKLGWKAPNGGKKFKGGQRQNVRSPDIAFYGVQDRAEAHQQRSKARKQCQEMKNFTEVVGSFELGHEPLRIRSFHRKFPKKAEKQQTSQENMLKEYEEGDEITEYGDLKRYPYRQVTCSVEWHDMKDGMTKITVKDSTVAYWDLRVKAPHLLCDFFERHMQIV